MKIPKQIVASVKCATLVVTSWFVGVAFEIRSVTLPAVAAPKIVQPAAIIEPPPTEATPWWKTVADALQ